MPNPPKVITELVQKFERNFAEYKHPKYNETQIRVEFVNPFWKALGWDVDNEKGYAMAYRDVVHEDDIKVGRTSRAPDYAFRVGGTRKFFLETKKPYTDLKHDPAPAFQLRRYAYSAKLPISMLTDFEEFIVYNCRTKPAITDKPHAGRMVYYTFREYPEKWGEISERFSKEAVLQGNFDRFIEDTQGKRPRAEIDRDFLDDLDNWRITLARNIALRNPDLSERELNYAVQLTIDRLIFLRMCEDRDIEQYETLLGLTNGARIYPRLVQLYYKADSRYNSGLFQFEEKDGPHADELTPKLSIDDKALKDIISELYYPKCPYEFSVLPVEVLGNAYEQFLGKRITLTKGHRARIEQKPEVRKAGGVYYTPQYIVDYIVKNTVGKLCEGKTPTDISELRVLDPACGSGSFLLGAFQYLLDWHVSWYRSEMKRTGELPHSAEGSAHGERRKTKSQKRKAKVQAIFQGKGGEWYLTTSEKKHILTNNIFGVDIDANAVEVTKLSLLLKVLEHESSETLNRQLGLWQERALPNLASNIKCGNSLIGTDFYEQQQTALFDEEKALRVNAFDWEQEFPEIFSNGGFDAVVGNPPYVDCRENENISKDYWKTKYISSSYGKTNTYEIFIEKSISILKDNGQLGYIIPIVLLNVESCKQSRKLLSGFKINEIAYCELPVFKHANVDTMLLFLLKKPSTKNEEIIINQFNANYKDIIESHSFLHSEIKPENDYKIYVKSNKIFASIAKRNNERLIKISDELDFFNGIATGPNKEKYLAEKKLNSEYKPLLMGNNIGLYSTNFDNIFINYDRKKLHRPRKERIFLENEKIVMQRIRNLKLKRRIVATLDTNKYYTFNSVNNLLLIRGSAYNIRYFLGVLNSTLLNYLLKQLSLNTNITINDLELLPIRSIDFSDSVDKSRHDHMVRLVERMLVLHQQFSASQIPQTSNILQRQIAATDKQIDQLVYQLYGLTDEEIKIVEDAVK